MKIELRNRLEVLMKDSGVNTFEEMSERLTTNQNIKISRSALSRKFRDDNVTLSLSMIEAICNELQCLPGDLFETSIKDAMESEIDEIQSRLYPFRYGMIHKSKVAPVDASGGTRSLEDNEKNVAPKKEEDLSNVLGPTVTHLHAKKLKD